MITATNRALTHPFFHDRLGLHDSADFRGVLHVPDEFDAALASMDHVAVGVAFNAFVGRTCCIHIVIQRPDLFSHRILRDSFTYAFDTCGLEAVLALVDSANAASMDFTDRVGFTEVARIPSGGLKADLVIKRMLRAECRWLRKPH